MVSATEDTRLFGSFVDSVRSSVARYGWRDLYRGYTLSTGLHIPTQLLYMSSYNFCNDRLQQSGTMSSFWSPLV